MKENEYRLWEETLKSAKKKSEQAERTMIINNELIKTAKEKLKDSVVWFCNLCNKSEIDSINVKYKKCCRCKKMMFKTKTTYGGN